MTMKNGIFVPVMRQFFEKYRPQGITWMTDLTKT